MDPGGWGREFTTALDAYENMAGMWLVGEDMPQVAQAVAQRLAGAPFVGCFTFGEQGAMQGRNMHGNLMISAIAFGK